MTKAKRIPTIIVATFVVAAMTIVSCSHDETVSQQPTVTDMPIGFNVVVDNNTTTRSVVTTTTADFSEFDVWAFRASEGADYVANGSYVMGVDATRGFLFRKNSSTGVLSDSIKNLGVWGYANKNQITFWPHDGTQYMSFYAVSPSSVSGTVPHRTMNVTNSAPTFTYEAYEAANGSHADQRDLLIAGSKVKLTTINKIGVAGQPWMSVPLTFKHALSQVKFDAKLAPNYPKLKVTLYDITICNVARKGTCTIIPDATSGTPSWSLDSKIQNAYKVTFGGANGITLYSKDGVKRHDPNTDAELPDIDISTLTPLSNGTAADNSDNIMVIPQTVTPWNTATAAASQTNTYLKIHCGITQNGHSLITESYVYVPLAGTIGNASWNGKWEAGKCYTYHLQFGLGYDSQGNSYGSAITYAVSVSDTWTTPVESSIGL